MALGVLVLAWGILEVGLRVGTPSARDGSSAAAELPDSLEPHALYRPSTDPILRYELIPNARARGPTGAEISINAAGFRGSLPANPTPPGVQRVVVLGDSETFGAKLAEDETFPARLHDSLVARHGGTWEVLNLGVEGYDTAQETRLFEVTAAPFTPDVVVLYFVSNDVLPPELVRVADGWDRSLVVRRVRDVALLLRGRRLLGDSGDYRTFVDHAYGAGSVAWRAGRVRVLELAAQVAARHARFVVVVAPEIFGIERRAQLADTPYRTFHEALRGLAEDHVAVVDPLPALVDCAQAPTELWVTPDDHHKNGRANRCIADFVVASGAIAAVSE